MITVFVVGILITLCVVVPICSRAAQARDQKILQLEQKLHRAIRINEERDAEIIAAAEELHEMELVEWLREYVERIK